MRARGRWRRGAAAVLAVAALALPVAGCGAEPPAELDVLVSGDPGSAPTITYTTPLHVSETVREVVWPGTGDVLAEGAVLLLDFVLENATDATVVRQTYDSGPVTRTLTVADLGAELYETLLGERVGARLLQVSPAGDGGFPTVSVVDVLPTRATGTAVDPRADLPAVTEDAAGAPAIAVTGTPGPVELTVAPLLRGTGPQVEAGQDVTVQFTGFRWDTGDAFDTTWDDRVPVSFPLSSVPAWQEGLDQQTVGSRVLLVVPPSYALGAQRDPALAEQTLVFVIDILAARSAGGDD